MNEPWDFFQSYRGKMSDNCKIHQSVLLRIAEDRKFFNPEHSRDKKFSKFSPLEYSGWMKICIFRKWRTNLSFEDLSPRLEDSPIASDIFVDDK